MKLFPRLIGSSLLVISTTLHSQTEEVKFNLITGSNGVFLGKINAITRDKYGFMWFSDQDNRGIIRYDGTKMVRYRNDPQDPNSLGGAYPECLFADSSGIIWIGFYGMGLDRFDPRTNVFVHYRHHDTDPQSLSDDFVTSVLVDHLGNVWVGNYGGVDLLDTKTGKFKHYRNKAGDTVSLSCNKVRALYEDHSGELWVGTGFAFDGVDEGGLNRFNRKTGTFIRYLHDPRNPNSLMNNKVRAIFEDSHGNFWVGTMGDGLNRLDRKTGVVTRLLHDPKNENQLSRPSVRGPVDHITFITEDYKRNLWIGTFGNGVVSYDPVSKQLSHYTRYNGNIRDTSGWCAYPTSDGSMWLVTQGSNGLYKVDLHSALIPHYGNSYTEAVTAISDESPSIVWFGTFRGLVRRDFARGTTDYFKCQENNVHSLSGDSITSLLRDKSGNLWIGTNAGLNRYDPQTKTFTRYPIHQNDTPQSNVINFIYEDRDSRIMVSIPGSGLYYVDPITGKFTGYELRAEVTQKYFSPTNISSIKDDSIFLWCGLGNNGGLLKVNYLSGLFKFYLPGLTVNAIRKDRTGVIWIGTNGGLFRYERDRDNFTPGARINDALAVSNAFNVIVDSSNNLWLSSTPGIYKINAKRDRSVLYGSENGVSNGNDFLNGSAFFASDGKIYLGNINGYYGFSPNKVISLEGSTQLWFTGFRLNNADVRPGPGSILQQSIFEAREIRLGHSQNVFSFEFSVVNFRTEDNKIYYKLENYDGDWRTAGSERRADYFRVPPGKYSMHIRTPLSSSDTWMEKSINIVIMPPWWSTWWAYCIYGLLFVVALFLVHRYQRERVLKKEREQTRDRELAQAKEIERAYHELKMTQAQLIQSEKMASLGELTAGIAHEIQNPLNFVNNFSDVNRELLVEMNDEITKGNYDEVSRIAKDVIHNQEKIDIHGKRADAIVKGMLQHSRPGGAIKEPSDINRLADEYLRLAYQAFRARDKSFNATFSTDFDNALDKLNIVPQDIGRVLLNLINNAFYAVNEKAKQGVDGYEPTVIVGTRRLQDRIEISVKDNGNGIPSSIKEKIFQPFFTTKPTGQGTGLGLSLAYDIVKAHGGDIHVETKEGEGSEFIMTLGIN